MEDLGRFDLNAGAESLKGGIIYVQDVGLSVSCQDASSPHFGSTPCTV